ncbi:hypothetical protein [Streptomyces sp. SID2999]|uniref:hypothetical protein n=1 Tax=Streptomyces sp. SID2999 TaxID=2690258 RepID=UPI00192835B4|nr:hypothetical protein [Streptomyces sp. SID2999]
MNPTQLAALFMSEGSETAAKARAALPAGGTGIVWDGTAAPEQLARIYCRRLRLTRRTGQETAALEHTVDRLAAHHLPVRLGQVTSADGAWTYLLFLSQDARTLLACTGVRRRGVGTRPNPRRAVQPPVPSCWISSACSPVTR